MISDERATKVPTFLHQQTAVSALFTHRIRTVATDSGPKEQAALLTTACAKSSRIQRLVTNAVASKGVCIDGQEFVADAILYAEHAFLEICDVKVAARRFKHLAERREEKKRWSSGSPSKSISRERCRLLSCLKCLSECATNAGRTQATRQWTRSSWGLTRQCSECHLPGLMSELSGFDFEPERFKCDNDDASIIGCSSCRFQSGLGAQCSSRGRIQIMWRNISHSNTASCRASWMAVAAQYCAGE